MIKNEMIKTVIKNVNETISDANVMILSTDNGTVIDGTPNEISKLIGLTVTRCLIKNTCNKKLLVNSIINGFRTAKEYENEIKNIETKKKLDNLENTISDFFKYEE